MWSVNDVHTETHQKPNMAGFLQSRPNELVYFDGICHGGFPAGLKKYITDGPHGIEWNSGCIKMRIILQNFFHPIVGLQPKVELELS